ncbi:hemicentin-1-like [Ruditapes philippinarum]|uniref:hemicentin-1-like n=1 Tax=Ruditapes philippinarum TaxID=129788 RepID=UPI00295B2E33|nr:hemicentin-1-like [Ruditapes philippinarum]
MPCNAFLQTKAVSRWVPRILRVQCFRELLKRNEAHGEDFLDRIVSTDETWLYYHDPDSKHQSSIRKPPDRPQPKKDRVLRRDLVQPLRRKQPQLDLDDAILHHDNAHTHRAHDTELEVNLLGLSLLPYPPYSPDLTLLDYLSAWQCPNEAPFQSVFAESGQSAVISFLTTVRTFEQLLVYNVYAFNGSKLYIATFYNNILRNEKSYLQSKFVGNASAGNFTVKTVGVHLHDGGVYMLGYKEGSENINTEHCSVLFIIDKPKKPTLTRDSFIVQGTNSSLICSSLSTSYPTNHTMSLTYNWNVNGATNPSKSRYVYSPTRKKLTITSLRKEDANTTFTCSATESGPRFVGLTSDNSDLLTFTVIYGPDVNTTRLLPSIRQYTLNEGVTLNDITCSGECFPRCNYKWTKSGQTVSNNSLLSLATLSRTEADFYMCEVTNANKTVTKVTQKVEVRVNYGPDASSVILLPPTSRYILNEEDVINDISISGDCFPVCLFNWTKAGSLTFAVDDATLSLGSLDRNEAGTYICTVSNPTNDQTQTRNISVFVRYGPDASSTILTPAKITYSVIENTTLHDINCASECYPKCHYKWTMPNRNSMNTSVLSLGKLHRNEAGTYTCTVTSTLTTVFVIKQVAVFVTYGPDADSLKLNPSQSSYPENEGTSLNDITCSTACYPKCTYKWTKSGSPFIESNVLSLGTLNKDKAATYTCTAFNPTTKHNVSTSVIVHVRYGPYRCDFNTSSPYVLKEGETLPTITCKSDCYPLCLCKWKNSSSGSIISQNMHLDIGPVTRYHNGSYICICENTANSSSASTEYFDIIAEYLTFTVNGNEEQTNLTVDEYESDIQFKCLINIYFETKLQIKFQDTVLVDKIHGRELVFTRKSAHCLHAGIYTCHGKSRNGAEIMSEINLFVRCSPRPLREIKTNFSSELYNPVTLMFTALAYPEPEPSDYTWYKKRDESWTPLLSNTDLQISSAGIQTNLSIWECSERLQSA